MKIGDFCNPWNVGHKITWRPPVEALRERCRLYRESAGSVGIDLPCVPLSFAIGYGAIRNNIRGFEWIPDRIPRFRELWRSNRRPRRAR